MTPKLMHWQDWLDYRFTGERKPSRQTVSRMCERGDLPAKKIGAIWYIEIQSEINQTGNPLVDAILNES